MPHTMCACCLFIHSPCSAKATKVISPTVVQWAIPILRVRLQISPHPFTLLHFAALHFTSLHFTSLHVTSLHPTSLLFSSLLFSSLLFSSLHFTSLLFSSLLFSSLLFTSLHFTSLHFTSLRSSSHINALVHSLRVSSMLWVSACNQSSCVV